MRAIVYERYGPPEVLALAEVETPVPGDEEILVKVRAATVIAGDCEVRSFTFPLLFWIPLRIMFGILKPRMKVLGQELAGDVVAVGKSVTQFKTGDAVFCATGPNFGAYADFARVPMDCAIAVKPEGLSYEQAAAIPTGGLNALHYLRKGRVEAGERVLIIGAAGNFGSFAVQLAKHFGAHVTAVDSGEKLDMLRAIGADRMIDYTRDEVLGGEATYDVIFDVVSRASFSAVLRCLRPQGRYVIANPRLHQILRGLWTSKTSDKDVLVAFAPYRSEDLVTLRELVEDGKIAPVIDRRFPFEQVVEAHRYVESGRRQGNVVLSLDPADGSGQAAAAADQRVGIGSSPE